MRTCLNPACGVILLDTDERCPVCNSMTADAGSGKMEKPVHNEPRIVVRRRSGSRFVALLFVALVGVLFYFFYKHVRSEQVTPIQTEWGNRFMETLIRAPDKKK